ncbi:hypothetical protein MFERI14815_00397 [Mycoplasma feriruminatoris]|uniref:Lipoprotein n=1 Tax=Mycoplasma feriruminatoris TaxID=1179777 RepID=A0AAX3TEM4_9MOLU|nr:lipoprotein [Mycoplasma feriruminatoris]WFQ91785.1 hypothetical protein MFERI14815_00397 [Mycoplasma feriruminatoris]WFQ92607.1 hypothetical protein MFERI14822_00395 [Mycoplasma feriruminatoris]
MKKLLTILGSLTLITSGGALVVACNNKNTNTQANTKPETTPANSDKDGKQPSEGDKKPGDKEPNKDEKQPGDKDGKQPGKPAPKTPEKKPVKKPVNNAGLASANDTKLLFDDTMKQTLDAWTKSYKAKIEKAEKDKLNAILAAKAARDYEAKKIKELFDTFDRISDYEKDEAWVKAEKKRIDELVYRESIEEAEEDAEAAKADREMYYIDAIISSADSTGRLFDDEIKRISEDIDGAYEKISEEANDDPSIFDEMDAADAASEASSNYSESLFKNSDFMNSWKREWHEKHLQNIERDKVDRQIYYEDATESSSNHTEELFKTIDRLDTILRKQQKEAEKKTEEVRKKQEDKADAAVSTQPRNKPINWNYTPTNSRR